MKQKVLFIVASLAFVSCSKPTIFVLKDSDQNKYYLSDSVKVAFKKDIITKTLLVAIDGVVWDYDKTADTIILPFKKEEIRDVIIISKSASTVIYGDEAQDGALVITTVHL